MKKLLKISKESSKLYRISDEHFIAIQCMDLNFGKRESESGILRLFSFDTMEEISSLEVFNS